MWRPPRLPLAAAADWQLQTAAAAAAAATNATADVSQLRLPSLLLSAPAAAAAAVCLRCCLLTLAPQWLAVWFVVCACRVGGVACAV